MNDKRFSRILKRLAKKNKANLVEVSSNSDEERTPTLVEVEYVAASKSFFFLWKTSACSFIGQQCLFGSSMHESDSLTISIYRCPGYYPPITRVANMQPLKPGEVQGGARRRTCGHGEVGIQSFVPFNLGSPSLFSQPSCARCYKLLVTSQKTVGSSCFTARAHPPATTGLPLRPLATDQRAERRCRGRRTWTST